VVRGFRFARRVRPQPVPPEELAHTRASAVGPVAFLCVTPTPKGSFLLHAFVVVSACTSTTGEAGDTWRGVAGRIILRQSLTGSRKGRGHQSCPHSGAELYPPQTPWPTICHASEEAASQARAAARWRAHLAERRVAARTAVALAACPRA